MLTVRGRRVLLVLAVAALLLVTLTIKAVVSDASPSIAEGAMPPTGAASLQPNTWPDTVSAASGRGRGPGREGQGASLSTLALRV